jgi:MFS family permease
MSVKPKATPATHTRGPADVGYRRLVALLMMVAYTANSADRTLIAIIGQSMKIDLGLSDTQLGLLVGTAFVALYTFSGVVVARLAERFNRVTIISVATALWSALTGLLGFAQNFVQLLVIRMTVGVFEAGCTPPAHSLLSDYFPPHQRTTALSFYSCGISVGYIVSAMLGGWVALHHGWRSACMLVGLPGVLIAITIRKFVREPPRGGSDRHLEPAARTPEPPAAIRGAVFAGVRREFAELGAVARLLLTRWSIANIVLGVTIATFAAQGSYAFVPAYFNRAFGLDYATIGIVSGLAGGVSVAFGLLAGGYFTDWLGRRALRWYAVAPAIGLFACTPLYVLAFLESDWRASAWLVGFAAFFQYVSFGPTFGVVQNVVDARRRATATALIYILLNVIGLGLGPLFTGALIDRLAEFNFAHPAADTVTRSVAAMLDAVHGSSAHFAAACPAGHVPPGSIDSCRSALAIASREGIAMTVLLYTWAGIHYLLGAIGLEKELRAAVQRDSAAGAGK